MKTSLLAIVYKFYKIKEDILAKLFLKTQWQKKSSKKKLLIVKTDAIGDYILFRNFLKEINEFSKCYNISCNLLAMVWVT